MNLILASASPRRRELLAQAGFDFTVCAADLDESIHEDEDATSYVMRLAEEKAQAIFRRQREDDFPGNPLVVLGADTSVVVEIAGREQILGKPLGASDAERMLRLLSGRTHRVLTGLAAVTSDGPSSDVEATEVTFAPIPEADLAHYCATREPLDKAGAYGIQGYAARWIPRIEGCYFNVMGLPIARTVRLIEDALRSQPSATKAPRTRSIVSR